MKRLWRSTAWQWGGGAILAAFACLFAPRTAFATCGDYLHILPAGASAPSAEADKQDAPKPSPAAPCRGSNCSRGSEPVVPPSAPPAPTQPPTDLILTLDSECDHPGSGIVELSSDGRSSCNPLSIFHPPRS